MNSTKAMTWWVAASREGENTFSYDAIVGHFFSRGINISADMDILVGADAQVSKDIASLDDMLVA